MTRANKDLKKDQAQQKKQASPEHSSQLPSTPGLSPQEIRAKDITPNDATWNDVRARNITSEDPVEREESLLDEAIDLTFPASDPTAELPAKSDSLKTAHCHDSDEDLLDDAIAMTFPASDPIAMTPHDKLMVLPRAA